MVYLPVRQKNKIGKSTIKMIMILKKISKNTLLVLINLISFIEISEVVCEIR